MRKFIEAIILGILTAFLTICGERYLPKDFLFLVDTKIIWLLPAFLLSFGLPRRFKLTDHIVLSSINLLATNLAYHFGPQFPFSNFTVDWLNLLELIGFSVVFGAVVGSLACLSKVATNDFVKYVSVSLLPAIYTGGGIDNILGSLADFQLTPEILTEVIGGFILYILLSGKNRFKYKQIISYASIAVLVGLFIFTATSLKGSI